MTAKPQKRRGRPKLLATTVVSVRIPDVVLEVYCRRCAQGEGDGDVRTLLRRALTIRAGSAVSAKEARGLAMALLLSADEMERRSESRGGRAA